jgi:hypothetical protein
VEKLPFWSGATQWFAKFHSVFADPWWLAIFVPLRFLLWVPRVTNWGTFGLTGKNFWKSVKTKKYENMEVTQNSLQKTQSDARAKSVFWTEL